MARAWPCFAARQHHQYAVLWNVVIPGAGIAGKIAAGFKRTWGTRGRFDRERVARGRRAPVG